MRLTLAPLTLSLASVLALGCGDDATTPGDGGGTTGTTGPGDSTGTPPDTTTSMDGSSGDPETSTTGGSSGGTTSSDTTTDGESSGSSGEGGSSSSGGGMGVLEGTMSGLMIFQDCMPIVPPDPVGVSFTVTLNNTGDAPASADVISATFVDAGGVDVGTIEVLPAVLGPVPAGESTMTAMTKVPNSLVPAAGCGVVMCNQSYDLELVIEVDGVQSTISDNANVDCVF